MPKKKNSKVASSSELPSPPVPPEVDLRDVPLPVETFIKMAMDQFGMSRDEASKLVHETLAQHHGAKGNA